MFNFICSLLVLFTGSFANAQYSNFQNYRDPIDGQSLHGWYGPLEELKQDLNPNKNYAIAIFHNPVNGFLFDNVHWFRSTALAAKKKLKNSSFGQIGHFQVAWSCRIQKNGKRQYGITGQSGERDGQATKMLLEGGYGLSIFLSSFTDGVLQSAKASSHRIAKAHKRGYGFQWVAFEVSQRDCARGISFLDRYISSGAYENFSFYLKPEKYKGGGCVSFASTLLNKFGVFNNKLIRLIKKDFKIPRSFVGNPTTSQLPANTRLINTLNTPEFKNRKRVSLLKIGLNPLPGLFSGHIRMSMYGPEKIGYFLRQVYRRFFPNLKKHPIRKAYGLNKTHAGINPSSNSKYVLINRLLTPDYKGIYRHARSLRVSDAQYSEINSTPGVIISR